MEPAGTQVCVAMFMEDGALHGYTSPQGEFFPSIMEVIQKVCNLDYGGAKTEWQRIKRVAADNNAKCHKECADILQGNMSFSHCVDFCLVHLVLGGLVHLVLGGLVHFVMGGLCIGCTWYWVDLCTWYLVDLVLGALGIGWTWYWVDLVLGGLVHFVNGWTWYWVDLCTL
jgi:hypothetical protein